MKKLKTLGVIIEAVSQASKDAKALGLVYGGFRQWIDPKTRETKALTVNGKLVKKGADDDDEDGDEEKGRLSIIDFDDSLLDANVDLTAERPKAYCNLIKGLRAAGGEVIVMCGSGEEKVVAKFMASIGLTDGLKVAPIGHADPDRKKEFVKKKIKSGYKDIQYFDDSKKNIAAIESLRATFNRAGVRVDTHVIPAINPEVEKHFDDKTTR